MKITKLGHCCLVIEEAGIRILTDPGAFSTLQGAAINIDGVLITHEHQDHLHLNSVRQIISNNPGIQIYSNNAVGKILRDAGLNFNLIEDGRIVDIKGIKIEGHGRKHAVIYEDYGQVENTGFLIAGKLFYPGDAFYNPKKTIKILALPVAGPWMKASEAINYAKEIKPEICFPVHDAIISKHGAFIYQTMSFFLEPVGIKFNNLEINIETEF